LTLLSVKDVDAGYTKLPLLHGVSLEVAEGEVVAVVGPNGAGKTTLMKSIFRLLPLRRGTIEFEGRDLGDTSPAELSRLGAGLVPQEANTFPDLSVDDNLRVGLVGVRRSGMTPKLERMYERFPALANRRDQRVKTLSGGERQMVALASAMIKEPKFLALDEPTTGLAPSIVEGLISEILVSRAGGTTVLWVVEENPLQVLRHVDRVYFLRAGVIQREFSAAELLDDESLQALFFGSEAGAEPAAKPS
jgi:branched-chain amino acid transport system ATP-binding protein